MENQSPQNTVLLELPDQVIISLPDDLRLMTPFIIAEQGDWFEDEIRWMRKFLEPGMRVLDIGANYGTYSLTASRSVGESGRVWSVEPTSLVVQRLRESKNENGFGQMTIFPCALGKEEGEVSFFVQANAELNSMTRESERHKEIRVDCRTLNALARSEKIENLDFLKIDAEGHECAILKEGLEVFDAQSPIVMFEIKHGNKKSLELWHELEKIGYRAYILCPGINVLVPMEPKEIESQYVLNLFAVKANRFPELENRGLVCPEPRVPEDRIPRVKERLFESYLSNSSYGREQKILGLWKRDKESASSDTYLKGLDQYAYACQLEKEGSLMTQMVFQAFDNARFAFEKDPTIARALTLIRLASQLDRRDLVNIIIAKILQAKASKKKLTINEPFLSPTSEYDKIDAGGRLGKFIESAVLFQKISLGAYSSYFNLEGDLEDIRAFKQMGISHPKIERRAKVARRLWEIRGKTRS